MKNFERTPDAGHNLCYQLLRKDNPSPGNFREILVVPPFFRENKQRKRVNPLSPQKKGKSHSAFIFEKFPNFSFGLFPRATRLGERNPIQRGQAKGKYVTASA